jgi:hypothetical protein
MPIATLAPTSIVASTNLSGAVTDIDEAVTPPPVVAATALNIDSTVNSSRTLALSGVAGDLFVACVQVIASGRATDAVAGWTDLFGGQVAHTGAALNLSRWMYRVLTGAESNPTFAITGGTSNRWGVTGVKITGANAAPIDDSDVTNNGASTNDPICPASTTTDTNRLVLRWFTSAALIATQDANYPAGTTGLFARTVGITQNQSVGLAYHEAAAAGNVGAATFTDAMAAAVRWLGATIAIK